jgi:hypothetical protein
MLERDSHTRSQKNIWAEEGQSKVIILGISSRNFVTYAGHLTYGDQIFGIKKRDISGSLM